MALVTAGKGVGVNAGALAAIATVVIFGRCKTSHCVKDNGFPKSKQVMGRLPR